ncbi:YqhR family membrane protein [Halobacillus sp. Marseille-Q1614]|uniref:YqhR family membrane protein n=1 Tax=Halobacillus sp. Marseille-Q1614 TaxID=2709134 RepID=UPI001570057B|nr:YqhR family membrane protein [Halobacillus sp. Marseille-Q1614]
MSDKPRQQQQKEPPQSVLAKTLTIGFMAGLIWSTLGSVFYYFNFTQVSAATFIFRSFWQTDWTGSLLAEILAVIIVGLLSIVVALVYYLVFKSRKGIWPGLIYGLLLYAIIFVAVNPVFSAVPSWSEMSSDSYVTNICVFILYGVFTGYSISYEYQEYNHQPQ